MRIKWLHLSDIHFNYKNFNSNNLRKDFISQIKIINEEEPFTHLFLSGDILFRYQDPSPDTINFLIELMNLMDLDNEHVIIVPGNHDHDRKIAIDLTTEYYTIDDEERLVNSFEKISEGETQALLNSFRNFDKVYSRLLGHSYYFSENPAPHIIDSYDHLNILRLNTAWLDTDSKNDKKLCCGSYDLQNLLAENEVILQQGVNIAIGHHPLDDFLPAERKRLIDLFKRYGFGLYFCGHRHKSSIDYNCNDDLLQLTCPGGFYDGYSTGGYVWGIIDDDSNFYKAEFFDWNDGNWCIDSSLDGTKNGVLYFNTKKFSHNSNIVAVDLKLLGGHIPPEQLFRAIGCSNIDIYKYDKPIDFPLEKNAPFIEEFCSNIDQLISEGKSVHLFPLAHIPLLLKIGFELQNQSKIIVHQYDREKDCWVFDKKTEKLSVSINEELLKEQDLVVSISTSHKVDRCQIDAAVSMQKYDFVEFKIDEFSLGEPLFHSDVVTVAKTVCDYLNNLVSDYRSVHLFAAIPCGLAIELGRRMLKSIYSNIYTYQFENKKYELALLINPVEERKSSTNISEEKKFLDNIECLFNDIVPLPMLGEIACGDISDAISESGDFFPYPSSLLSSGNYYCLKAKGDSMIDAGICEGDVVLVRQQETADDGQIVVAIVDHESTLKRLYHDHNNKKIILHPENKSYEDQYYDDVCIQGIVVKVIKDLF